MYASLFCVIVCNYFLACIRFNCVCVVAFVCMSTSFKNVCPLSIRLMTLSLAGSVWSTKVAENK